MSEKIIVKLRRDNISVSSCKEGVYLTFDAENARPIICKYSEVITIFTPNQIYDVEDIMLMLGRIRLLNIREKHISFVLCIISIWYVCLEMFR